MTFDRILFFGQILLTATLCSGLQSCVRTDVDPEEQNRVNIIGHGGIGFQSPRNQLPHNSLESAAKAFEFYNADGVEVDIQLSADGSVWMYHDATLSTMTDCAGCIPESTDKKLKDCRYANHASVNVWNGDFQIARLSELLLRVSAYPNPPYIFLDIRTFSPGCTEINADDLRERFAQKLDQLLRHSDPEARIYLTTPDRSLISLLQKHQTDCRILYEAHFSHENMNKALEWGISGLIMKNSEVQKENTARLRAAGLKSCIFGVKVQPDISDALNKSPDFIMTDNIPLTYNTLQR